MSKQDSGTNGPGFPCPSLDEALPHLRRPLAPVAVRFKIQHTAEAAAKGAAFVGTRLVFDRLSGPDAASA